MKCYYHPEVDSVQECRICGHPLCGECPVDVKGVAYCRDCLQARLEGVPPSPPLAAGELKSPKVAGWLSVMPGLGLVYVGQYFKALIVWALFLGAIQMSDQSEVGGPLAGFLWFAQIIYAVQEARRINRLRSGAAVVEETPLTEKESPLWGGILVAIGALLLLDQFDLIRFGEIFTKFWPVLIIVLGLQILLRGRTSVGTSRP